MAKRRITKLLVANRGEIAVRIVRTAKAMGYETVAVFSDADAVAPVVAMADEAVRLGEGPAADSYLNVEKILAAAKATGADAVHPGYGFLSENGDFAQACADAGLVFVGPPVEAIRLMGDKVQAKRRMLEAGVPSTPGYHGTNQDEERLTSEAHKLGVPLLVKAVAGGGGRGMRRVHDLAQLSSALKSARSEASNAFANGDLFLERLVEGARHIEIQVFADTLGNAVHLGERECSVQRRHQKVIEEAPSVVVDGALRAKMGQAAVTAAKAIDYVGAGTVEFLLDDDGSFYFLEMNTRLQVEHPVTELVTGVDLVAWQLLVADGEPLPLRQEQIHHQGHAIEARLYAEDPYAGFLPSLGEVALWNPAQDEGMRIDAGIVTGQTISPYYDAMVAKVIASGKDRHEARRRLIRGLRRTALLGLHTNRNFLLEILRSPSFERAEIKTDDIDKTWTSAQQERPEVPDTHWAVAAAMLSRRDHTGTGVDGLPWGSVGERRWPLSLVCHETKRACDVQALGPDDYRVSVESAEPISVKLLTEGADGTVRVEVAGARRDAWIARRANVIHVDIDGRAETFEEPYLAANADDADGSNRIVAPMGGKVISVDVAVGDAVEKGQCVAIVEAMKMEHRVTASMAGTVAEVTVVAGDQVAAKQSLVVLREESNKEQ